MKTALIFLGAAAARSWGAGFEEKLAEWGVYSHHGLMILTDSMEGLPSFSDETVTVFLSEWFGAEKFHTEAALRALEIFINAQNYELLLFMGFSAGEMAVRLGLRLGGSWETNVETIEIKENGLFLSKRVYSQNLIALRTLTAKPVCLALSNTVAAGVRKKVKSTLRLGKTWFIIRNYDCAGPDWLLDSVIEAEEAGNELTDAKHAVVAGRGLRNKQNMQTMYALAEKIKGKLGGTRAAVADGMLPLNVAVGSSGKVLCPDLCLTFGVSGAMPLMTGIEKSRLLISVNTDSEAAVFRGSDFGVCGDWKPVAETLIRLIDDARKKGIGGIDGKKLE